MRGLGRSLALCALVACVVEDAERRVPLTTRAPEGWIDVELASGASLPGLACSSTVVVLDADGRERARLASLPAGQAPVVTAASVVLGDQALGPPPVELHPAGTARLAVGGDTYRGDLRLVWSDSRAAPRLLNRVALEDYLLGVVPAEMPDHFGLEALKAQAVAARSYALAEVASQGFLYGDTRSQAYGGRSRETPLGTRAVHETSGEVLVHRGRIVTTWYHSTCGGRTLPAREVFGGSQAGVLDRGVLCPDCKASPFWSWERSFDAAEVCSALGVPVAPLESVSASADAYPARPAALAVVAGGRAASAPLADLRERLSAGQPLARQMLSTQLAAPPGIRDGRLVLAGRGYGHGVGLCQYGAAGFAARGGSYAAILERYYPGATLSAAP
jgi:stage II sporulation protein D